MLDDNFTIGKSCLRLAGRPVCMHLPASSKCHARVLEKLLQGLMAVLYALADPGLMCAAGMPT